LSFFLLLKPIVTSVTLPHISRCKQWVGNCHRPDLVTKTAEDLHRNYKLCSKHFETAVICQQVSVQFLFLHILHLLDVSEQNQTSVVLTSGLTCACVCVSPQTIFSM